MALHFDLHTHSFFSGDGVSTPEEMIAAARARGLHGFALTDHNTCEGIEYLARKNLIRLDGLPVDGILVIPGVEISAREGHVLCLGATLPDNMKGRPAAEVCREIHARGGLAIPPHPFDAFRAGIRESVLRTLEVDAIEVYNAAATFPFCNRKAHLYAAERGLPMICGSDAHHAESVGLAYTALATDDFTLAGVLRQIARPGNRLVEESLPFPHKLRKTWNNWMRLRWRHRMRLKKL